MATRTVKTPTEVESVESYALDSVGQEIQVGDSVAMNLVVTGIHTTMSYDPDTKQPVEVDVVNIARLLKDGTEQHLLTVNSSWVTKLGKA